MSDEIIGKLEAWFMDDSSGVELFVEEFAKTNKDVFDLDQEENKQEYMQIYNDFQSKFESKLELFLKENGYTAEQFVAECKKHQANTQAGFGIVDVILATLEYDLFLEMMRDAKRRF
jgi:hypothetical protein